MHAPLLAVFSKFDSIYIIGYVYSMPTKKSPQKGAQSPVHKVVLYMPADLHKGLKVRAAEEETSMSAFVNALLKEALKKGGEKKK